MHTALIVDTIQNFFLRPGLIAIILLFFSNHVVLAKPAERCAEPVFGAAGILVDQRAATSAKARSIGVEAAAQKAFSMVLNRLLLSAADQKGFVHAHSRDAFTDFVHIVKENNLEKRYIAELDFCFDAERLRAALVADRLKWAELLSPPLLVLPVWIGPDGVRAWLTDNQWLSGWREMVKQYDGLVSLRNLKRSLAHERRFRGEDILAGDPIKLAAAARITKSEQIMVVVARMDYTNAKKIIDVEARLFSKNGQPIADITTLPRIKWNKSDPGLIDDARQRIISRVEGSWQAANLINTNAANYLLVNLPVNSLKEWSTRLDALAQIAVIQDFTIRTVNSKSGTVSLELAGSRDALQNALVPHKLVLVDNAGMLSIVVRSNIQ